MYDDILFYGNVFNLFILVFIYSYEVLRPFKQQTYYNMIS